MKFVKLYTGEDGRSHFEEVEAGVGMSNPIGSYSEKYPASGILFREFEEGAVFDWHNAPQPQYIIYLEGLVEVEVSNGVKRIFNPGDVLFATDITGEGHVTRTLTRGRSVIVTTT